MAITAKQATIGAMVRIIRQEAGTPAHLVGCTVKINALYLDSLTPGIGIEGKWFFALTCLELQSDYEAMNPTSHPLSAEELPPLPEQTEQKPAAPAQDDFLPIKEVFHGLEAIMRYKNQQYGNTGLQGIGIFSKANTLEKLLARADDKVARINNSPVLRKNDCVDLLGYLVLICAHKEWFDFTDQQD